MTQHSRRRLFRHFTALSRIACGAAMALLFLPPAARGGAGADELLRADDYAHYVRNFNAMEPEGVVKLIPNAQAWDWMVANIPLFDCPAKQFE
jgi:hypothetical protein